MENQWAYEKTITAENEKKILKNHFRLKKKGSCPQIKVWGWDTKGGGPIQKRKNEKAMPQKWMDLTFEKK